MRLDGVGRPATAAAVIVFSKTSIQLYFTSNRFFAGLYESTVFMRNEK